MPLEASPSATAVMNGCFIPAPAPWARTRQARGSCGDWSRPETRPRPSISIATGWGAEAIASASRGERRLDGHAPSAAQHAQAHPVARVEVVQARLELGGRVNRLAAYLEDGVARNDDVAALDPRGAQTRRGRR